MFPFTGESFQWRGTNFIDLYEWLTKHSTTKNLKLKILLPGVPNSPIEITIDDIVLRLNIDDWITKSEKGIYFVEADDE